jgi:alpha-L-fucosidase
MCPLHILSRAEPGYARTRVMATTSIRRLIAVLILASLTALPTPSADAIEQALGETPAQHDARMKWWREARFGMFIHWGPYAVAAGDWNGTRGKDAGEWIMSWANIPRAQYETLAPKFNPVQFDAAEWVRIAKAAGMKYLVITSKHHDGFAMFDTAVSAWDIVDATPWRKDPMRTLADEAKKQGLKFCFYYSIMDWHHPSQFVDKPGKDRTAGDGQNRITPDQKAGYVTYMKAQLKELVTKYDPEVLWFDGEWVDWWTEADGKDLYAFVRGLKPSILVNNRVGKGRDGMRGLNKSGEAWAGDFGTPEQEIPPTGIPGVDWESCMTMNQSWGFKSYDTNWKSSATLIRNLIDIASKGGNYLLNVGPTPEGRIPDASVARLGDMGKWLAVNGEAIYGTTASPFKSQLGFGRATSKGDTLYLHVFDWPKDGKLEIPGVPRRFKRARLLADPSAKLTVTSDHSVYTIDRLPTKAPDAVASVIALEM